MKVTTTQKDGVNIVAISGKLMGGPDTGELDQQFYALLGKGVKKAIVDLGKCEWMNSSGLSILIHHYKKFKEAEGELVLAQLTKKIKQILIISGLMEVYSVYDTVDEAVDACKE